MANGTEWQGEVTPAMLEAGAEEAIKPPCGIWTPERLEAVYRRMRALDDELASMAARVAALEATQKRVGCWPAISVPHGTVVVRADGKPIDLKLVAPNATVGSGCR